MARVAELYLQALDRGDTKERAQVAMAAGIFLQYLPAGAKDSAALDTLRLSLPAAVNALTPTPHAMLGPVEGQRAWLSAYDAVAQTGMSFTSTTDRAGLRELRRSTNYGHAPGDAAIALGLAGATEAVPELRLSIGQYGFPFARAAMKTAIGLALLRDGELPDLLLTFLETEPRWWNRPSAEALEFLVNEEHLDRLRRLLANPEASESQRAGAALSLGGLGDPAPEHYRELIHRDLFHGGLTWGMRGLLLRFD